MIIVKHIECSSGTGHTATISTLKQSYETATHISLNLRDKKNKAERSMLKSRNDMSGLLTPEPKLVPTKRNTTL